MTTPIGKEPEDPYALETGGTPYVPYDPTNHSNLPPTLGTAQPNSHEFEYNTDERCAVVLVLDNSNSMKGEPIRLLNEAVSKLHRNLTEDPIIAAKVDIAMVMFNHNLNFRDFVNATEYQPPVMEAGGGTNLSFALRVALDMVAKRKEVYRANGISYHRPWIILITDGYPQHDSENELNEIGSRIREADSKRECSLFTITCGDANDTAHELLREKITPPGQATQENYGNQFQRIVQLAQQLLSSC